MSIKKLFGSTDKPNKYLSDTTEKEAFQEIESARNLKALNEKQNTYVPQVDYSDPASFAKYGSAYLYYKSSMERVADFFPYDGSDAEINEYHNKSLDIDKYIFNNLYPRTNGYIHISSDGWGTLSGSKYSGFGLPSSLEYIDFKGGPNTITASNAAALFGNPNSSNTNTANIYDTDIYTTAKLPSNFGSGSRESNLKSNFDDGVTVEFWAKTGSLGAALTNKQVFVDIWNNEVSSSAYGGSVGANPNPVYGRITIAYQVPLERFVITAQSGSTGIFEQKIGTSLTGSLSDWKHYAVSFYNSGSSFITNLHVDGKLNDSNSIAGLNVNEINSKNMVGRIGALLSSPSGAAGSAQQTQNMVGAGKLSGSLDEFRFWKAYRNSHEIAKHYFTQVRGGANTDISNTTLGLYYKFNEGITGTSTTDSVVLDYSGRISNGTWTGYSTTSRNTGSAIISASAAGVEYEDPIIRTNHSDVTSLKKALLDSGSYHDNTSISSMLSMIPSWIVEEQEKAEDGNVQVMSHIIGAYFDKLHLMITALPKFNSQTHTSASYTPLAFAQHLPQSLGLYTPEIFVDSDVLERFMNRNQTMLFEGDLIETKNLIYLNLYNNLTNIYKSKGTEKSIRNVFRCFNVDEKVLRFNTYAHNATYELKDNFQQTLINKPLINLNKKDNLTAVIYQAADAANGESLGYISGSNGAGDPGGAGGGNDAYEDKYGFTAESSVIFPKFNQIANNFDRNYADVSLFGMYTVNTGSANSLNGTDTTFVDEDFANFQVMAVKDKHLSKNVYFKLTSSISPYSFPELTSSTFFNVYDDNHWNFSVRLKPSNYPLTDIVTGSEGYTYDVIFKGINTFIGTIQDSFTLTGSVSKEVGRNILRSAKRLYAGARRTNVTGNVLQYSDVLFSNVKYWTKYLDDSSIERHLYDFENRGVSGSYQPTSPRDANIKNVNILNLNTLALDWNFENVTSSNTDGTFVVTDMSSGSALIRDNYGWIGKVAGYQHTGYGKSFATSSSDVITKEAINVFKYIDPEKVVSSDMVQILTEDDKVFGTPDSIPSYRYTLEKSMHNAISEEMLKFFAGAVDFNNVIGEPVNRYRAEYKTLRKLREIFFRKVVAIKDVEDYIDYYKWFDDSLAQIIGQLLPASSDFESDVFNTIESHVLERNKYETKFPTLEFIEPDLDAAMQGAYASTYPYEAGSTPLPTSPRSTQKYRFYWDSRAERGAAEITSNNSTVDEQRDTIRDVVFNNSTLTQSIPRFSASAGLFEGRKFTVKRLAKTFQMNFDSPFVSSSFIKGGVNFTDNKNIHFTYNALYPAGPVNRDDSKYVPRNVIFARTEDMEKYHETVDLNNPRKKYKRYIKAYHGRDWENGTGYSNVKSSYVFPFNIISPAPSSGYNKAVIDKVTGNVQVTNLHNDSYYEDMDVPMQGPFTNFAVGGHQSRHVALNTGGDDYTNRPEAWKLLLGATVQITGAIGMVGADYPWPEANAVGEIPYPMTASQKAVYYRNVLTKRPVNIRNIQRTTSSALGNYSENYEVVMTVGAYQNPRCFIDNQPTLPSQITQTPSASQGRIFLDIHRTEDGHTEFIPSYSVGYLTGTNNKSVIVSRFSTPGAIETMGVGYKDIRSAEYSVYNVINYRNLTVIKPSQGPSGTISEAIGSGTPGIRVYDIHAKDYGLRSHLARHTARFGRDSFWITGSTSTIDGPETTAGGPGASDNQFPGFHKVHRNTKRIIKVTNAGTLSDIRTVAVESSSQYDNYFVQHAIPRSDRQYSWITSSLINSNDEKYFDYASTNPAVVGCYSASTGYISFFDFVSGSSISSSTIPTFYQPINTLNVFVIDPVSGSTDNVLGFASGIPTSSYYNKTLLDNIPTAVSAAVVQDDANYFNLLMSKRGNTFGWNWKKTNQSYSPIIAAERKANYITIGENMDSIKRYSLPPVTTRGRPVLVNFDSVTSIDSESEITDNNITFKITNNNEKLYFSDIQLEDYLLDSIDSTITPFDQILTIINSSTNYNLNWIRYSEALFPSARNEFRSSSIERTDYDNKFWRDSEADRVTLGATVPNSFGYIDTLSQSSWILDAQEDWKTRTGPVTGSDPDYYQFPTYGKAGELQNNYFSYVTGTLANTSEGLTYKQPRLLRMGALYSRKHMISTPRSARSPTGPKLIVEQGVTLTTPCVFSGAIAPYSGEALWEAASQAGIIERTASAAGHKFTGYPSVPWFNEYKDFKEDIKLQARGYAIIPEFRISEHVRDYLKFGINNVEKMNTFEIPGTDIESVSSSFYVDYSNSEFMKDFLNIKNDSLLNATEIKLVCSAAIRFNPYKGFYPAQRTLDLVSQFSHSYAPALIGRALETTPWAMDNYRFSQMTSPGSPAGAMRPLMQTLFSPGLLYNSIKSGLAVDYPVVTDTNKISRYDNFYGSSHADLTDNFALTPDSASAVGAVGLGYSGSLNASAGEYWDKRIPFEAIMNPAKTLNGLTFYDVESHPSMSMNVTSSWSGKNDDRIYTLMARNFFGEVGNFFLKDQGYTKLQSTALADSMKFPSGSWYGARLVLRRTSVGARTYEYESGSAGNNEPYGTYGGLFYAAALGFVTGAEYPLPQDPRQNPGFRENFTMYSRPSAFGPPIGGRPTGSFALYPEVINTSPVDSFSGFNWAYTPPYYNGEAWVDLVFKPNHTTTYDLEQILSEIETVYRRVDPGYSKVAKLGYDVGETTLLSSYVTYSGSMQQIYSGRNVNSNAMQISASINLFGIESVDEQETDKFGNMIKSVNKSVGNKWVIQPKFETPMLNFADSGIHSITASNGNLTLPSNFGSGAVPQGMWHQFGTFPSIPSEGVFLEIGDIPTDWLKYHYDVVNNAHAVYNDSNATFGRKVYQKMKSLTDLVGFEEDNSVRLGEVSSQTVLREAIVAVPYIVDTVDTVTLKKTSLDRNIAKRRKSFIDIPTQRYDAALSSEKGSLSGDSLDVSGESIRKLVQKMDRYILPPQFDFLNNEEIDPIVMYIFEFEYKLDKDDLSYIWQNLAPRNFRKLTLEAQSISHELSFNELLSEDNIMDNDNLRWMVFKVKQKSQINYGDLVASQVEKATKSKTQASSGNSNASGADNWLHEQQYGHTRKSRKTKQSTSRSQRATVSSNSGYEIGFNWPYDYVSFVEMVKMDAEVLYGDTSSETSVAGVSAEIDATAASETSTPTTGTTTNRKTSRSKTSRQTSRKSSKSRSSTGASRLRTKSRTK